jgi:ElaB/YqjD/DUF883 family membrane-anchored ribosome-binding protein
MVRRPEEDKVTADAVLSREVKSLHDEVSAARNSDPPPARDDTRGGETGQRAAQPEANVADQGPQTEAGEIVKAIAEFVAEAENNIATHPAANMLGALVVGILIGRLLARR